MRVASIIAEDIHKAGSLITQVTPFADVIELRLDHWQHIDMPELSKLRDSITLPLIVTLRSEAQGGKFQGSEAERLTLMRQLMDLHPEYVDIETDVPIPFVAALKKQFPHVLVIGSYHDFTETPADLAKLFERIYHPIYDVTKFAVYANSSVDTLRLLIFSRHIAQTHRIAAMAMGEYGEISRILAPVMGSVFVYGSVNPEMAAAPGQLTLQALTEIYRVHKLSAHTKLYALLGDPIQNSQGHHFHNQYFAEKKRDAVYVKLKVKTEHMAATLALLRQLPFYGFSVTMPHKLAITPLLDRLQQAAAQTQVVNTIHRVQDQYLGYNTDGAAVAEILSLHCKNLSGKAILILGAGGAAQAIAYSLHEHGAQVVLCNRTQERVSELVARFGYQSLTFENLLAANTLPYTAMINTLPVQAFEEQCAGWQIPSAKENQVAFEVTYQANPTPFLTLAALAGWHCISGEAMFVRQAQKQQKIWEE